MKLKLIGLSIIFVFFVISLPSFAAEKISTDNPAKQNDIKKLLLLTGSGKLGVQVMNQMIESFKKSFQEVPHEFWVEFMSEVNENELMDLCIPVYDKYFTHDDIKALINFYESPAGKKLTSVLPQVTRELITAGQEWGKHLGQKAIKKLKNRGYNVG